VSGEAPTLTMEPDSAVSAVSLQYKKIISKIFFPKKLTKEKIK
jgi:hypothetical protein